MTFEEKLKTAAGTNDSMVCVGLDPDSDYLPNGLKSTTNPTLAFLKEIVEATKDLVCAYKPNFAFYGALGPPGWEALAGVIQAIPDHIPIILDYKAGDIGNTAKKYAQMAYDQLGVDAVTVNPFMGTDALQPFLSYKDRFAFLLCLTSNEGSSDIQRLSTKDGLVYQRIAHQAIEWQKIGPCGLVVGATHPNELSEIRAIVPNMPFLIPGVGSQGGDAAKVVKNGADSEGAGILVNASRSILFASGESNFAQAAREATIALRSRLNEAK